jgi:hypothetical protein
MTAILFRTHELLGGRHVAWAAVCAEARYAGVLAAGTTELVRRGVDAGAWREIEHELSMGLPAGPLPASGAISRAVVGGENRGLIVQYVTAIPINSDPAGAAAKLDAVLHAQPAA